MMNFLATIVISFSIGFVMSLLFGIWGLVISCPLAFFIGWKLGGES